MIVDWLSRAAVGVACLKLIGRLMIADWLSRTTVGVACFEADWSTEHCWLVEPYYGRCFMFGADWSTDDCWLLIGWTVPRQVLHVFIQTILTAGAHQPWRQPLSQPLHQPLYQPLSQPRNNLCINQPLHQLLHQPLSQPSELPNMNHLVLYN